IILRVYLALSSSDEVLIFGPSFVGVPKVKSVFVASPTMPNTKTTIAKILVLFILLPLQRMNDVFQAAPVAHLHRISFHLETISLVACHLDSSSTQPIESERQKPL
ncbi:MAG: hypothetical protein JSW66_06875, partial [Phycisphaerales bacterium]